MVLVNKGKPEIALVGIKWLDFFANIDKLNALTEGVSDEFKVQLLGLEAQVFRAYGDMCKKSSKPIDFKDLINSLAKDITIIISGEVKKEQLGIKL